MKTLISIPVNGRLTRQEEVEVVKMIFVEEFILVLHRPAKHSKNHHCLWHVSDAASGIRVSRSISPNLAIKLATKRMGMHKKIFLKQRKSMLKHVVFVD